ncbi:MAG TPA: hypothetical protein PK397_04940 [Ignavibacteriaceae bacterium]|nr:hypothetical protein [Ignavibacteriaceae bacterium]
MSLIYNTWLPFIYLYGVGGIFFLTGIVVIRKSKSINLNNKRDRYWLKVMYFGFFYFMVIHAVWILIALYT